ncbi:MAG: DUF3810 domain-containing protein [Erysipelotrichaceae bacterium]|nr:DUF3810 domain-containing protein [Erysipelotrichaceae bacterium]
MKKNLIIASIIVIIQLLAFFISPFATFYATHISPVFVNTVGRLMSLFPFSFFEFVVIALLISLIYLVFKVRPLTYIIRYLLVLILVFTCTCGINYRRSSIVNTSNLELVDYDNQDLEILCNYIIDQVNQISSNELTDSQIITYAKTAMNNIIPGYYPNAKPLLFSRLMTLSHLTGIFSPFTIEANYNKEIPQFQKPFTICHELSHLQSYMIESEANFIAYLACINSDNSYFRYSGYLIAFIYVSNALYKNGVDVSDYYNQLSDQAYNDLAENQQFWNDNDTFANITNSINDAYLKANSVSEGTKSYSQVVDYIYSYHYQYNLL